MKNILLRVMSLVLGVIMMLTLVSCSDFWGTPENTGNNSNNNPQNNAENENAEPEYERQGGVYTMLFIGEGQGSGSLVNLFVASFDTVGGKGVNFLQIPVKTYIRNEQQSIENYYRTVFNTALGGGDTEDRAKGKAIEAIKTLVVEKFKIPVDYYVSANSKQLGNIVEKLGGVEINIPYVINLGAEGTLTQGKQMLNGDQVSALTRYSGFSENVMMDFYKCVISAIYTKAKSRVSNDVVTLFVHEIRENVVTDIPSDKGEDIFFMRKFLEQKTSDVKFTQLTTGSCAVAVGMVQVLSKTRTAELINSYLAIYSQEYKTSDFDKDGFFNNTENQAISVIYQSAGNAKTVYTAESIANGGLSLVG